MDIGLSFLHPPPLSFFTFTYSLDMFIEQLLCDGHSLRAEDKSVNKTDGAPALPKTVGALLLGRV